VQAKIRKWMENGAKLGWLIDPETRMVCVRRPRGECRVSAEAQIKAEERYGIGLTKEPVRPTRAVLSSRKYIFSGNQP